MKNLILFIAAFSAFSTFAGEPSIVCKNPPGLKHTFFTVDAQVSMSVNNNEETGEVTVSDFSAFYVITNQCIGKARCDIQVG